MQTVTVLVLYHGNVMNAAKIVRYILFTTSTTTNYPQKHIKSLTQPQLSRMSAPVLTSPSSPDEILLLQGQQFSVDDVPLLVDFCSQPGLLSVLVPDKPPSPQAPLKCQKCTTCVGGFRPRSRLRTTTCKCGHAKKWHILVEADPPSSLAMATNSSEPKLDEVKDLPTLTSALDIDNRKVIVNFRTAWEKSLFYHTEPRQVMQLRLYPLSPAELRHKCLQFFPVSASRATQDSILPSCGIVFTGLPTPGNLDERVQIITTLLDISPYNTLLDKDHCLEWLRLTDESNFPTQ